jgi:hypothetical protein
MVETTEARSKALAFAKRGYRVVPLHAVNGEHRCTCGSTLCKSPGKHPHGVLVPHGKDDATTDRDVIKGWFDQFPWLNYGVCTDDLPTIDIDPRNDGKAAWLKLIRKHYDVHTWRVATGGGGEHIMFAAGAKPLPSAKLVRGVDFKSAGGYVCGVGSVHQSGKKYQWAAGCSPRDVEIKGLPPWIVKLVSAEQKVRSPRAAAFYTSLLEPALPGERHDRVASLIGHLFGSAFPNRRVLLALVVSHVKLTYPDQEDFDEEEIIQIARDLAKSENKKRGCET